jgi:Ni/Co efflux regulator RcnB
MKKVLSIVAMLVFVAGFAMAQNSAEKGNPKPLAHKEAKADTTKKHSTMKHHTGKKGTTTKTTKKSSSTTTEKSTK